MMILRFKDFKIGRLICNLVICNLLIGATLLFSQVDTAWVRRYNGPENRYDDARSLAVDSSGNVYVTGYSYSLSTYSDYATVKYNSAGVQEWVQRYNGPGNYYDYPYSLAVDGQSNVYVTGYSYGLGSSNDYATIKYNSAGDTVWVRRYNGPGNDYDFASSLAVDGQGNVYVTGASYGSGTDYDYATIKYNSAGVEQWVQRYNGPGNDEDRARSLAVDGQSNVYVTGYSISSSTLDDYATIKYNSAGDTQWVRRYNGPANSDDDAYALAVDSSGNVYVTGSSVGSGTLADYATIKYNSAGVQEWVQRYNGPGNSYDGASAIVVDASGNVYVTGVSYGSGTLADYATIKYNSAGVQEWVQRYNGPGNSYDGASAIVVDASGNVYVTGYSGGSGTYSDYATIKYNSAGVEQWIQRYNGPGNSNDDASSLALDGQSNVYVTGTSYSSGTDDDYATIKYVQTSGVKENNLPLSVDRLSMYPNPARAYFTIRLSPTADRQSLKIFDVSGKMIKEIATPASQTRNDGLEEVRISLKGINPGIYFFQLGKETKKFLVVK